MAHEPQIQQRGEQPYVAIPAHVPTEAEFRKAADSGFPELFGWLRDRAVEPAGPLFIRYLLVTREGEPVDVELAVPVGPGVSGDGRVRTDTLPAGSWATLVHIGPYNSTTAPDLQVARAALREWIEERGLVVASQEVGGGTALHGCVEHYRIGPVEEADYTKWETELAYLTAPD
jgi:effector-binding domain-containing protein